MRLHVHEWGDPSAPPLVCLHGVSAHGRRFRRLAEERWAGRFRVVAPDLRGHGRSDWEPPWRIETYVRDVLETADALGIAGADWVGHSFGGRLVLELAARAPERVARAVLLDPAIHVLPHIALDRAQQQCEDISFATLEEAIESRRLTAETAPREFLEEEMSEHLVVSSDGRLRYRYSRACVAALYGELSTEPPPPETLRVPTLLVHAPEFGLVRERHLVAYHAALGPLLEEVTVPGGHIVFWDAYEQTADAVDAFLA